MPKNKKNSQRTSSETRSAIIALKKNNPTWTRAKVARILKISWQVVNTWWDRESVVDKPSNQVLLTPRTKRLLKFTVKKGTSIREAAKNFKISSSKVYKEIRRSKNNPTGLFPYKVKKIPCVNKIQKKQRKNYLQKFPTNKKEFEKVYRKRIIYDEKPFQLFKPPNHQNNRLWSENAEGVKNARVYKVPKGPSKIHIFAAISYYGKSEIRFYVEEQKILKGKNKGFFFQ